MKKLLLLSTCLVLSGCAATDRDPADTAFPQNWTTEEAALIEQADILSLKHWWLKFNDPALNELITRALSDSPDRKIAEARILEARGLKRTARSTLFPQIGARATAGRQDSGLDTPGAIDSYYEAGFDASFELDIFGKNLNNLAAADAQLAAAIADYHGTGLTLVADIVRTYIDYRAAQAQKRIAQSNLETQEKTLSLVRDLYRLGDSPRLDVERAENLVNTTRSFIPEYERQAENAALRLSVLIGGTPRATKPVLAHEEDIPGADVKPVLLAPADVLALRPDVRAAHALLAAQTDITDAVTADLFPALTLQGFYGIGDGALLNSATLWNVALGAAISLLDFGRIEGRIDAARAREQQAYETYRKTILQAVSEVETALNDYSQYHAKYVSLEKAYQNAQRALTLAQTLYQEGEAAFLDVLDAQRQANNAQSAMVTARAAQAESLARLYKSLGIY